MRTVSNPVSIPIPVYCPGPLRDKRTGAQPGLPGSTLICHPQLFPYQSKLTTAADPELSMHFAFLGFACELWTKNYKLIDLQSGLRLLGRGKNILKDRRQK